MPDLGCILFQPSPKELYVSVQMSRHDVIYIDTAEFGRGFILASRIMSLKKVTEIGHFVLVHSYNLRH